MNIHRDRQNYLGLPHDSCAMSLEPEAPLEGAEDVKSLTSEAKPSATQFFMRAYKISHFPGL